MSFVWQALASLLQRRLVVSLSVLSIALGSFLLLSVERFKNGVEESFSGSISQVDLIAGTKGGPLELLLYTVFHLGSPVENLPYAWFEQLQKNPKVKWAIPIALGDSYANHRVIATNRDYFKYFRFREDQSIQLKEGHFFQESNELVLGSEVAHLLQHQLGDAIFLAHGIRQSSQVHEDHSFIVKGILRPTGTPIDRAVFIPLEGMSIIHRNWQGAKEQEITSLSAVLIKTSSPIYTLMLQREINQSDFYPMMGHVPGLLLQELWQLLKPFEWSLKAITWALLFISVLGVMIGLISSLAQRDRELAILRSVGASPFFIVRLLLFEAFWIGLLAPLLGILFFYLANYFLSSLIAEYFGLYMPPATSLSLEEWSLVGWLFLAAILAGPVPAVLAYRQTIRKGLAQ